MDVQWIVGSTWKTCALLFRVLGALDPQEILLVLFCFLGAVPEPISDCLAFVLQQCGCGGSQLQSLDQLWRAQTWFRRLDVEYRSKIGR